jgi:RNase P/RNase MRP subunit p30
MTLIVGSSDGYDDHFNRAMAKEFVRVCRVVFILGSKEETNQYTVHKP